MMAGTRLGRTSRPYLTIATDTTMLGDLDVIAMERALNGEAPMGMTRMEKATVAKMLADRGVTPWEIAQQLHMGLSTVRKWQANDWDPAGTKSSPRRGRRVARCGTPGGYKRHLSRSETTCPACRAANAEADRRYRLTGTKVR
jgi:hypothetical protein